MNVETLNAAQLCAIAGAVKPKDVEAAKRLLPPSSSHRVSMLLRVEGLVTKGADVPASTSTVRPTIDLLQAHVIAEALRRLKVTPQRLRRELEAIAATPDPGGYAGVDRNRELLAVFDDVAAAAAAALPARTCPVAGRSGAVRCESVTFEIVR